MAKGLGLFHSDHIKGSVSGITMREYRGLATATCRPWPRARRDPVLSEVRSILSYLSRYWGSLSIELKDAWKDWAQGNPQPNGLGGTFILDGNQAHMMLNHTAMRLGGTAGYKAWPPATGAAAVVDTLTAAPTPPTGQMILNWTLLGTPDATDFCEVMISELQKYPDRRATSSKFHSRAIVAGNILTYTIDTLNPGGYYMVGVRYISNHGQKTNIVYAGAQAQPA